MIAWRTVPWSVSALCACMAVSAIVLAVVTRGPVAPRVGTAAVLLVWAVALLQGIRWIWVATVVISGLALIAEITSGSLKWYGAVLTVVELVLLLHPQTRAFYKVGRSGSGRPDKQKDS